MTALLELKQKIKNLYGQYEIYILPVLKFVLALVSFMWINANMGYMSQLDNVFVLLILALICSILPPSVTVFVNYVMMVLHGYALSMEVGVFLLLLILLMMIFFMRFSSRENIVLAFTPMAFGFNIPVLLPIGSGLLSSPLSAIPAGCGVVLYFFIRFIRSQASVLGSADTEIQEKLKIMADGLVQNWPMWVTVIAFVAVILLVNLIRTRSFDYAWRISIIVGGVAYVFVMLAGGFCFNLRISMIPLIVTTVISVLVGIILEFFVFGGDYSRTERLEYEDDEYYYYVKAVPKASVATSERSIKKINAEPIREEKKTEETAGAYANPIFRGDDKGNKKSVPEKRKKVSVPEMDDVDFEKKLEESLKDL